MHDLAAHAPLARAIASEFYLPGADRDDVVQEAMIALWIAAREYRPERGMSFRSFAAFVIRRRLVTALMTANAHKHRHLSEALSAIERDGEIVDLLEFVADEAADPARIVEDREEALRLLRIVRDELSPTERHAVIAVANGLSYLEIGEADGASATFRSDGRRRYKRVENALQRARRKLADPFAGAA